MCVCVAVMHDPALCCIDDGTVAKSLDLRHKWVTDFAKGVLWLAVSQCAICTYCKISHSSSCGACVMQQARDVSGINAVSGVSAFMGTRRPQASALHNSTQPCM